MFTSVVGYAIHVYVYKYTFIVMTTEKKPTKYSFWTDDITQPALSQTNCSQYSFFIVNSGGTKGDSNARKNVQFLCIGIFGPI